MIGDGNGFEGFFGGVKFLVYIFVLIWTGLWLQK